MVNRGQLAPATRRGYVNCQPVSCIAVMAEVFCFACGDTLSEQTDRRKLLGTDAKSKRVFQSWKMMCVTKLDLTYDEIERIASDAKSPGIVCRYSIIIPWYLKLNCLPYQKMLWCL